MPPRVIIGDLAQRLLNREGDMLAVEAEIADVLTGLLPDWRGGWAWDRPRAIQIYNAIDSPAAATALHLAGFTGGVTIHAHGPKAFLTCTCERRTP